MISSNQASTVPRGAPRSARRWRDRSSREVVLARIAERALLGPVTLFNPDAYTENDLLNLDRSANALATGDPVQSAFRQLRLTFRPLVLEQAAV